MKNTDFLGLIIALTVGAIVVGIINIDLKESESYMLFGIAIVYSQWLAYRGRGIPPKRS